MKLTNFKLATDAKEFSLSNPINYHHKGQQLSTSKLLMHSPNFKVMKECLILKQTLIKQSEAQQEKILKYLNSDTLAEMMKNAEEYRKNKEQIEKAEQEEQIKLYGDPDSIMSLLISGDANIEQVIEMFKSICINGCVKTPEGESITISILQEMTASDFERLMGTYIHFFIIGSPPASAP